MGAVYYDDGGTDRVMVAFHQETTDDMETRIVNDPWGTLTVDSSQITSDNAIRGDAKDSGMSPGFLVNNGDTVYAFWVRASDEDIYRSVNVDGAGWAAETAEITSISNWWLSGEFLDSGGGATSIDFMYLDFDTADWDEGTDFVGNGHIEYASFVVSVGGAAVYPPFPRRQKPAVRM